MTTHALRGTGTWQDDDLPTEDELGADPGSSVDGDDRTTGAPAELHRDPAGEHHPARHDGPRQAAGLTAFMRGVRRGQLEAGRRKAAIAAIRQLADFYAANPDVPVPEIVTSTSRVGDVLALERIAEQHQLRIYGDDASPQLDKVIAGGGSLPGPWVLARVAVWRDRPL